MAVLFRHGCPIFVDYVATADVKGGDILVLGSQVRIAHTDIANGAKGGLAIGYGVYLCPKVTTGGSAIGDGVKVYWDATNKVITATAGANKVFGTTVGASLDADATQMVLHIAQ